MFQFYLSSIKSEVIENKELKKDSFNSTLVQLKAEYEIQTTH